MDRCLWCNGSDGVLRTVALGEGRLRREAMVHPEHEAALVAWYGRLARDTPRFVAIFAFTPLVLLAAIGLAALVSRSAVFVVLGLWLISLAAFVCRTRTPRRSRSGWSAFADRWRWRAA